MHNAALMRDQLITDVFPNPFEKDLGCPFPPLQRPTWGPDNGPVQQAAEQQCWDGREGIDPGEMNNIRPKDHRAEAKE